MLLIADVEYITIKETRMKPAQNVVFLMLMTMGTSVLAQSPNPFVGTWKVTWEQQTRGRGVIQGGTRDFEAEMIIAASGGSWKTLGVSRSDDPCVGREVAIAIEKQTDDEIHVRLKFSEVAQGCTDSTVRLKRVDDKKLTGTRGKSEVTATKQ